MLVLGCHSAKEDEPTAKTENTPFHNQVIAKKTKPNNTHESTNEKPKRRQKETLREESTIGSSVTTFPNRRILANDVKYLGAFRLPNTGTRLKSRFPYGGDVMAFNPRGNSGKGSLYINGHDHHQLVAEVSIATPRKTKSLKELEIAELVQPFDDITGGMINSYKGHKMKLGGLCISHEQIYWDIYLWYNVKGVNLPSHGISSLNLSRPKSAGMWKIGNIHMQKTAGYMCEIPEVWESRFGCQLITGASCLAGRAISSEGPAAFGFLSKEEYEKLPELGSSFKASDFLWYDLKHKPQVMINNAKIRWNKANSVGGCVFPVSQGKDKSSLIYFVKMGMHPEDWYGPAKDFPGKGNLCSNAKGYHGAPYKATMWFYDPIDLLKSKQNQMDPYAIQPYLVVDISDLLKTDCMNISACTLDPERSRIYAIEKSADTAFSPYERWPLVHVFEIN